MVFSDGLGLIAPRFIEKNSKIFSSKKVTPTATFITAFYNSSYKNINITYCVNIQYTGPAEALRQRRFSPQCFFPVKIRFFEIKK